MYTRLTTWTGATDVDGGIEYLKKTALPIFKQQKGYKGLSASADRSAGTFTVLSIWDSAADRDASESALGKARDEATAVVGGTVRSEKLEEVVHEVAKQPGPGSFLMVTPFSMDPAKLDENLEFFKKDVLPLIMAAPGFCAVRNMVDRSSGEGYVGTVWADKSAIDEQAKGSAARREMAVARGISFGEVQHREIIFTDTK